MPQRQHPSSQMTPSRKPAPDWTPRNSRSKSQFSCKVVTVLVGHWEVPFYIHQDLLSTSIYFSNIIDGPWEESKGAISIEHAHPEVFELYITWIYTKEVKVPEELGTEDQFTLLHHTYVFGDYIQDKAFKDTVLEAITFLAKEKRSYPHHLAELVYQQTMDSSPWRSLYIDLWLCSLDEGDGTMNQEWVDVKQGPREFFIDLLSRQSSSLFEKRKAEKGLDYVEKKRGRGRPKRVQVPALSHHRWRV